MVHQSYLLLMWLACIRQFSHGFVPSNSIRRHAVSLGPGSPRSGTAVAAIAFDSNWHKGTEDRFERTASRDSTVQAPCIIQVDGVSYNLTAWAKSHPGGDKILSKFHGKDATKAFFAAGHSQRAIEMLKDFAIGTPTNPPSAGPSSLLQAKKRPRWIAKLFTKEDPIGVHKSLGVFVLMHFIFRFRQMFIGDPSCGLGTRLGKGPSIWPALCLLPHAMLSLSSLIFHTVPRERVVGMPMIWSEYRVHNIAFGVRSVITAALAWASFYFNHSSTWRRVALIGSAAAVIGAQITADLGTKYLRVNNKESTTATMPYWDGCSLKTQKRFKSFYAYCQFMATMACLAVGNPGWPLSVLLAIQMASLLMTLVRKGLLSARGYHIGYTATLIMPWIVGIRSFAKGPDFAYATVAAWIIYQLRRRGINKYLLWSPVIAARIMWGDGMLHWQAY
ncbi:B5 isoform [Seminavis robusta]|uniref:B5 isoform n=1 Tax=Seminavis robusta TaxID=568900 RepID=A0A9N8HE36_9STRA|nr:B5 isoform [Seminavis robusta]|eukprot:Sro285_g108040.1 B5 isoform (446) ;mRNA; f:2562-3899